jgi:hypothetical protein
VDVAVDVHELRPTLEEPVSRRHELRRRDSGSDAAGYRMRYAAYR